MVALWHGRIRPPRCCCQTVQAATRYVEERPNKPADVKVYRAAQKVGYPLGHIILLIFHTAMRPGKWASSSAAT